MPQVVAQPKLEPLKRAPNAPRWLPPEGRALWKRVAPKLVEKRLLTGENLAVLEGLCAVYATARQSDAVLQRDGLTMTVGTNGYTQQRPEAAISHKNWALFIRYASELGLTPSAAARLGIELAELGFRRGNV